jgi:hypothetical protein
MRRIALAVALILPALIEAQGKTKNGTVISSTYGSTQEAPETEFGHQIEVVLSIIFLVLGMGAGLAKGVYSVILWILWPSIVLSKLGFHVFIYTPYKAVAHIMHVLYPVATFCFAAACFGIFIGGFAGIASEAISSLLIALTWGTQQNKAIVAPSPAPASRRPSSSDASAPQPVTERIINFGRRASRDFLHSGISSSASSVIEHGYFGERPNHRASFRTRQLSFQESEDLNEEDDAHSETSWDDNDDDTFTLSPMHATVRRRR